MKTIFRSLVLVGLLALQPAFAEDGEVSSSDGGAYGKTEGLLGPVIVGPKITVGAPIPFRFGLEGKWNNMVGLSFDYGFFPSLTLNDVSVGANSWSIAARYYPWHRAFYVGLGFGGQSLEGSQTQNVTNGAVTESVTATAAYNQTFIAPQIGWRWVWASGFFMGMEVGVQVPMGSSFTITTNRSDLETNPVTQAEVDSLKNQANAEADKYGNTPLPWLGLLQFGFFL